MYNKAIEYRETYCAYVNFVHITEQRERAKTDWLRITIICPVVRHVYTRTVVSVS
jgi:hypothetical protein